MPKKQIFGSDEIITSPYAESVWDPVFEIQIPDDEHVALAGICGEINMKAQQLLMRLGVPDTLFLESKTKGMEVGDDRVSISHSTRRLAAELIVQEEIFQMQTSWEDTYISNVDWNFCEVTSYIPSSVCESIGYAEKSGSLRHLCYNDSPTLRLIMDVQKGDHSHSSTSTGKMKMLGARMRTPRSSNWALMQLASWCQDAMLNSAQAPEPKYLDGIMGGSGCSPLWGNISNTYMYVKCYKHGMYSRVYGTAHREVRDAVTALDAGETPSLILCTRLREKQEYLHITYAGSVLVPAREIQDELSRPEAPKPLYRAIGAGSYLQSVERRLVSAKRVVRRSDAEVEMAKTRRLNESLFGFENVTDVENRWKKAKAIQAEHYGNALRGNAAVAHLLNNTASGNEAEALIHQGFLSVGSGVRDIAIDDVYWLCKGGKGFTSYTYLDVTKSEDMYLRSEVSTEETLKVPGITLTSRMSNEIHIRETIAKVGLWEVTESMEKWADNLVEQLLFVRESTGVPSYQDVAHIFSENREWVSDDPFLVEQAAKASAGRKAAGSLVLISADKQLAKTLAIMTGFYVVMVHPEEVIKHSGPGPWTSTNIGELSTGPLREAIAPLWDDRVPETHCEFLVDTGSFKSHAMRTDIGRGSSGVNTGALYRSEHLYAMFDGQGARFSKDSYKLLTKSEELQVYIVAPNTSSGRRSVSHRSADAERVGPSRFNSARHIVRRASREVARRLSKPKW